MTRHEHIEYWIIGSGMTAICGLFSLGIFL